MGNKLERPIIKIKFLNGLNFEHFKRDVFDTNGVTDLFNIIDSEDPDVIVFGPYGNDLPAVGNYTRVGYYCENIYPDMTICEWAFGVPHADKVNNDRYKRIQWHGVDPNCLVKTHFDPQSLISSKTKFCNFIYSNPVAYREAFFKQLSKYKKVDAPGKSMNNMPSIDILKKRGKYEAKRQFLSEYKFTIAFENYVYPGYQTEKLYDAMVSESLPIYCGDPNIGDVFNTNSFLNAQNYLNTDHSFTTRLLEDVSQSNFVDILPQFHHSPTDRVRRKMKAIGRSVKMRSLFRKLDFSPLIDKIILLDKDPDEYLKYVKQPWFHNNTPPIDASAKERWVHIFEQSLSRH